MKLRSHLILLVVGSMLPVLALTAALGYLLVEHEKNLFQQAAMDRNRTFLTAVDTEIRGQITSIYALAASRSLMHDNLRDFYEDARRVLHSQPDWRNVILFDTSGRQLVNVRVGPDGQLPRTVEPQTVELALHSGHAAIGDVQQSPLADRALGVAVRIPVVRDGKTVYVLSAIVLLDRFANLMAEQRFPDGWAVALVDSNGVFIARIPARPPGQRASPDFWAAIGKAPEGWFRGLTREGVDTYTAYLTSELTHWTVGMAIPTHEVFAVAYRVAWTIAIGGAACLLLALGFAYWMGRRISWPIAQLAAAAGSLGERSLPPIEGASIEEVQYLAHTLQTAVEAIHERESLRDGEQRALKAADKAKDEFLAMLGHELRNPLSAISAAAHLLRVARPGEDVAQQAHGVIERQTRQMTRLVEDLLDVSRLAMGKVTLKREPLELSDFAVRVASTWQQARSRPPEGVHFDVSPVWVEADRARLEQVICNLLDNADKFSPSQRPIRLRVARAEDTALLEIADQGEGIPAEFLGRIFELFVQGPQSSDRARGGMGLGLTLVKRLVELHGGSVAAASDGAGTGATFTVRLPAIVPVERRAPHEVEGERRAQSLRILVVEDNEDGRKMFEAMLRFEGHQVRVAKDGREALIELATGWAEVAIIDIGLPDIEGYDVARAARAAASPAKLIALTGYGQEQDQRRAYEAGFHLHLTKPVSVDFLRKALAVLTAKERVLGGS
jgi:signal transduction histidine kinase/CheY-like chemotaxis protein